MRDHSCATLSTRTVRSLFMKKNSFVLNHRRLNSYVSRTRCYSTVVMAGLDPAIHGERQQALIVIPGPTAAKSPESITRAVDMDSGLAAVVAIRNDERSMPAIAVRRTAEANHPPPRHLAGGRRPRWNNRAGDCAFYP